MERKKKVGHYVLGATIGEGKYCTVRQGTHTLSAEKVAVKVVHKKVLLRQDDARRNFRREAIMLQKLDHPHVVCLYEVLETYNSYYLVVQLADGGSFQQYVASRKWLDEDEAQRYFRQMASVLHHLQTMDVIHRDLTLENFLMKKNMDLLLTGFGQGSVCEKGSSLGTPSPSNVYSAPEMFSGRGYGHAVDVWSLGVCLHIMLTGRFPCQSENTPDTFKLHLSVLTGCSPQNHLSKACQDLLSRLLEPIEDKRISVFEIIRHKWVTPYFGDPFVRPQSPFRRVQSSVKGDILHVMVSVLNFNEKDVLRSIDDKKVNSATATYKLLSRRHLPPDQFVEYVSEQSKLSYCRSKCDSDCPSEDSKRSSIAPLISKPSISEGKPSNSYSQVQVPPRLTLKTCVFCENEKHVFPVRGLKISSLKDTHFQSSSFQEITKHKLPKLNLHELQNHHHQDLPRQQQSRQRFKRPQQHLWQHEHHTQLKDECHVAFAWSTISEDNGIRCQGRAPITSICDKYKIRGNYLTNADLPCAPPNTSHGAREGLSKGVQVQYEICNKSDMFSDLLIENSLRNTEQKADSDSKPELLSRRSVINDTAITGRKLLAFRTNRGRSMAILKKIPKHHKQEPLAVSGQMVPEGKAADHSSPVSSSPVPCSSYTSMSEESASNDDSLLPVIRVTITTCKQSF